MWQHFFDREVNESAQKPSTNGSYTDNRQYLATQLLWRWGVGSADSDTTQGGEK
jgi:hypothetical protein